MKPNDDSNWITRFSLSITSSSNRIFSNGRQQLEVSVSLTPKPGQSITEAQLNSIRLVTLDDDGNYRELSGALRASNERDERFEYYADTGTAPNYLQLESSSRRRKFYLSSTRPGGSRDTLYAVISKDEHNHYLSHTSKFNSSVVIESITPPRMNREDFIFWGDDVLNEQINGLEVDYDVYHLAFKNSRLKIVESMAHGEKEGVAYYKNSVNLTPWYYYLGNPEDMHSIYQCHYHYAYAVGAEKKFSYGNTSIKVNKRQGIMNFVRLKIIGDTGMEPTRRQPSRWGLLDQYGNEQKIEMTQASDGNIPDFVMID